MIPQNPQKVKGSINSIHIRARQKKAFRAIHGLFTHGFSASFPRTIFSRDRMNPESIWTRGKNCFPFFRLFMFILRFVWNCLHLVSYYFTFFTQVFLLFKICSLHFQISSFERHVHFAQIFALNFYVCANCTNFRSHRLFLPLSAN